MIIEHEVSLDFLILFIFVVERKDDARVPAPRSYSSKVTRRRTHKVREGQYIVTKREGNVYGRGAITEKS